MGIVRTVHLKPAASRIYAAPERFVMAVCGRRFGKSYLTVTKAMQVAIDKPRANILLIAPTFEMAKATLWRTLQELTPERWLQKVNHSNLEVIFRNGSRIECKSGDRPDRLRGRSLDHVGLDEAAYLVKGLWGEVVRPALADRQGSCLMSTTPAGTVQSWFADLWEDIDGKDDWAKFQFSTLDGGYVPLDEVMAARDSLDERTFRAEFFASFEAPTGRCYPDFDGGNITDEIEDDGVGRLVLGIDFNIATLPCIVAQQHGDELWCIDEITLTNQTTDALAKELRRRYPRRSLMAYPDPTGGSRRTSAADASTTDHTLLEQQGIRVYDRKKPYQVRDKIQTLRWMIRDATGRRRLRVHPRCKELIRDLKFLTFREGTDDIDKVSDPTRSHHSDGLGYLVLGAMGPLLPDKYRVRVGPVMLY